MDVLLQELSALIPDSRQVIRALARLLVASVVGAIIGFQREHMHKPAGLRTHMLVSLGSAVFVFIPLEVGMAYPEVSRIIQGIATGIGFIGGGAILKLVEKHEIEGLTTAAGIWLTAALGVAAGLGALGLALMGAMLAWGVLALHSKLFPHLSKKADNK